MDSAWLTSPCAVVLWAPQARERVSDATSLGLPSQMLFVETGPAMVTPCGPSQILSKARVFRGISVGSPMTALCRTGVVNASADRLVGQVTVVMVI